MLTKMEEYEQKLLASAIEIEPPLPDATNSIDLDNKAEAFFKAKPTLKK